MTVIARIVAIARMTAIARMMTIARMTAIARIVAIARMTAIARIVAIARMTAIASMTAIARIAVIELQDPFDVAFTFLSIARPCLFVFNKFNIILITHLWKIHIYINAPHHPRIKADMKIFGRFLSGGIILGSPLSCPDLFLYTITLPAVSCDAPPTLSYTTLELALRVLLSSKKSAYKPSSIDEKSTLDVISREGRGCVAG
jgi:hypothetical protein